MIVLEGPYVTRQAALALDFCERRPRREDGRTGSSVPVRNCGRSSVKPTGQPGYLEPNPYARAIETICGSR